LRVDIKGSDIKYGTFYRDDRCKELEEILSDDPKFREWIVEREHFDDENLNNDPYIVRDTDGKEIFMLEKWQLDALNPSELLSYLNVQREREICVDWSERAATKLAGACFIVGLISILWSTDSLIIPRSLGLYSAFVTFSVLICSVIFYYSKHKQSDSKKREVDLEAAENNPPFLEALRKLAAVPKSAYDYVYNEEHIERLGYINNVREGTDI